MRLLLQHGADAKIQNKHRETALDGAQEHAHSDDHVICAALLARHGERAMASNEDGHEEL